MWDVTPTVGPPQTTDAAGSPGTVPSTGVLMPGWDFFLLLLQGGRPTHS